MLFRAHLLFIIFEGIVLLLCDVQMRTGAPALPCSESAGTLSCVLPSTVCFQVAFS